MRDTMDQAPSTISEGGAVIRMLAQAKIGQLGLVGTEWAEQVVADQANSAPIDEGAPIEAA